MLRLNAGATIRFVSSHLSIWVQVVVAQLSHIAELACFYYSHVANEDDEGHEGKRLAGVHL